MAVIALITNFIICLKFATFAMLSLVITKNQKSELLVCSIGVVVITSA